MVDFIFFLRKNQLPWFLKGSMLNEIKLILTYIILMKSKGWPRYIFRKILIFNNYLFLLGFAMAVRDMTIFCEIFNLLALLHEIHTKNGGQTDFVENENYP